MPKSKGRAKKKKARSYVPRPAPKKKPKKESPRWYGRMVIGIFVLGVLIIVLNYAGVLPFSDGYDPLFVWVGLGVIAAGMMAMTGLR